MAAETELATHIDLRINENDSHDISTEQKHQQLDDQQDNLKEETPKCFCGETMIQLTYDEIMLDDKHEIMASFNCIGCGFHFNSDQKDAYWYHCDIGNVIPHKNGYNLCISCSKSISKYNTDPIKDIHNSSMLYFVYNKNKINGPFLKDEIITLFVTKKLKMNEMYIMPADERETWDKLIFPVKIFNDIKRDDEKRCGLMEECARQNAQFKQKYPDLYKSLIENTFSSRMRQVEVPENVPTEEKKGSIVKWVIRLLGKILAICMLINIVIHCIPSLIVAVVVGAILGCICICYCIFTDMEHFKIMGMWIALGIIFLGYSGIIITPILTVHFVLSETNLWSELQSWMIAYIVWGSISWVASIAYFVLGYLGKSSFETISNVILIIIGVDFGDFNVLEELEGGLDFAQIGIFFIFPSLASILPAAIFGFIANYYLEEKFELKCSDDISNNYLCFEEKYGCCQIISSHDIQNSYEFIGGLASNMLATWAFIRIIGYLLVNGYPKLSLYAKKT